MDYVAHIVVRTKTDHYYSVFRALTCLVKTCIQINGNLVFPLFYFNTYHQHHHPLSQTII